MFARRDSGETAQCSVETIGCIARLIKHHRDALVGVLALQVRRLVAES